MYRESPKKDDSFSSFKMNKNNIYIYNIIMESFIKMKYKSHQANILYFLTI